MAVLTGMFSCIRVFMSMLETGRTCLLAKESKTIVELKTKLDSQEQVPLVNKRQISGESCSVTKHISTICLVHVYQYNGAV